MSRFAYSTFPYDERLRQWRKQQKRQLLLDRILTNGFFFIFGAFAAVMILTYYPLPWR